MNACNNHCSMFKEDKCSKTFAHFNSLVSNFIIDFRENIYISFLSVQLYNKTDVEKAIISIFLCIS